MFNMSSGNAEKRRSMRSQNAQFHEIDEFPMTPSRKAIQSDLPKTPVSAIKSLENGLTPRRSVRKSIKPAQDYDEIILNKRVLRSRIGLDDSVIEERKWSPSKVGRISQKRSTRKGRSTKKSKVATTSSEEVSHSSEDIECKNDESKQTTSQKTIEVSEDIFNTTFDKESENEMDEKTAENQKAEIIEDILNTTFDKDSEEKLDDKIEIGDAEVEEPEMEIVTKIMKVLDDEEAEEKDSTASKDVLEVVPKVLKFLEEGNELGCTPILYDDNNEAEKNELKENDLDCVPVSKDDTFEKIQKDKVISEEPKEVEQNDEVFGEIENKVEAIKSNGDIKHSSVFNDPIEVVSDDEMLCLVLSDEEEVEKVQNDKEPLNDTFNASDCVIISPSEASDNKNEMQKINKMNLLAEAERKVKELQENYFSPNQKTTKILPKIVLTNDESVSEKLNETPRLVAKRQNAGTPNTKGRLPMSGLPDKNSKRQNDGTRSKRLIGETSNKLSVSITPSKRLIDGTPSKRLIDGTPSKFRTGGTPSKRQIGGTPISKDKLKINNSKGYRFPTPHKAKKDFRFVQDQDIENKTEFVQESMFPPVVLTTLEPKEIVLRSIRKRSLSVTIDGDQRKRRALNVTFHSPANETASIADLDKMLQRSAVKSAQGKIKFPNQENITRRKRSISLDEKYLRPKPSKLPRPVRISPQKSRPTLRTKLPNFAAIHQQQYQKMENLVDYVTRKAERAQNLTNSALKALNSPSSATKKSKPLAVKSLALTSTNKENASTTLNLPSSSKDVNNAEKLSILTPNRKEFSAVLERNKNVSDKLHQRTQRHIDMFKACPVEPKRATNKNADIIRGVRSNRRFELMMKHRKTSGN